MSQNNRTQSGNNEPERSSAKGKGKGSGQQTAGIRGVKQDEENEEHYRSGDQKKQKGNHGGNR
jgi:hypothetical protein